MAFYECVVLLCWLHLLLIPSSFFLGLQANVETVRVIHR